MQSHRHGSTPGPPCRVTFALRAVASVREYGNPRRSRETSSNSAPILAPGITAWTRRASTNGRPRWRSPRPSVSSSRAVGGRVTSRSQPATPAAARAAARGSRAAGAQPAARACLGLSLIPTRCSRHRRSDARSGRALRDARGDRPRLRRRSPAAAAAPARRARAPRRAQLPRTGIAEMLGTSEASVTSILHRAGAALEAELPAPRERAPLPRSPAERELVARFTDALEGGDSSASSHCSPTMPD